MASVLRPGGTLMGRKVAAKYSESELARRHRIFLKTHKKGTRTTKQILEGTDWEPGQLGITKKQRKQMGGMGSGAGD